MTKLNPFKRQCRECAAKNAVIDVLKRQLDTEASMRKDIMKMYDSVLETLSNIEKARKPEKENREKELSKFMESAFSSMSGVGEDMTYEEMEEEKRLK